MQEFQRQQLMYLVGVVPIPLQMTVYYGLNPLSFKIRSGQTAPVEQQLPNVSSQDIAVPNTKVQVLVPPQDQAFEVKVREEIVQASERLRHSHIVCVLRFKLKFLQQ